MAAKKSAKKAATKAPAKSAKKAAAKSAKKAPAVSSTADEAPPAKPAATKPAVRPSLDAVARAAYLNYRERVEQGLPGDSHGDWLEAERQLTIGLES